ncbi:hypothetical protein RRF57_009539 [Xylaria bambusicola]|uniref:Uncharacterized protein n=1 Tax=Xylaria bambusicola TaxID=326684 RepID=A0AAN7UJS6_9PEZI
MVLLLRWSSSRTIVMAHNQSDTAVHHENCRVTQQLAQIIFHQVFVLKQDGPVIASAVEQRNGTGWFWAAERRQRGNGYGSRDTVRQSGYIYVRRRQREAQLVVSRMKRGGEQRESREVGPKR